MDKAHDQLAVVERDAQPAVLKFFRFGVDFAVNDAVLRDLAQLLRFGRRTVNDGIHVDAQISVCKFLLNGRLNRRLNRRLDRRFCRRFDRRLCRRFCRRFNCRLNRRFCRRFDRRFDRRFCRRFNCRFNRRFCRRFDRRFCRRFFRGFGRRFLLLLLSSRFYPLLLGRLFVNRHFLRRFRASLRLLPFLLQQNRFPLGVFRIRDQCHARRSRIAAQHCQGQRCRHQFLHGFMVLHVRTSVFEICFLFNEVAIRFLIYNIQPYSSALSHIPFCFSICLIIRFPCS